MRYSFYQPLLGRLKSEGKYLDVDTANQEVSVWLNQVANQRVHGTTGKIPLQQLNQEQSHFQSLVTPYRGCSVNTANNEHADDSSLAGDAIMASSRASLQHELSIYDNFLMEDQS